MRADRVQYGPLFGTVIAHLGWIGQAYYGGYARVHYGAEVDVMAVLHTFNAELRFNSHVHALITAGGLQTSTASGWRPRIFFVRDKLFGLLTALGFAMDSTTLTRTLGLLGKQGWVRARRGKDRRERLFRLTGAGRRQMAMAQPHWERAERRLRNELGDAGWKNIRETIFQMTEAGMRA